MVKPMSNVIEFAHDLSKPMSARELLFEVRRLRREGLRAALTPQERVRFNTLLDEVEHDLCSGA